MRPPVLPAALILALPLAACSGSDQGAVPAAAASAPAATVTAKAADPKPQPAAAADVAATIRKALSERLSADLPPIDEISQTPIAGLYEVRIGSDIVYADATGDHLVQGSIVDTKNRVDLTAKRIEKLTAIDFAALPLKDALVYKQGTGERRIAVFADPNCGYCKHFERDLLKVKDVTVYTFLYPILGGDSPDKARDIWCSQNSGQVWRDWMIDGKLPPRSMGQCDSSVLDRNTAMGHKYKVNGTPAVIFEDGTRAPGAMPAAEVEKRLASVKPGKPTGS